MQWVVEISEDTFFDLKKKQNRTEVDNAVLNGTPLPKGHWIDEGFYAEGHSEHAFMCSKCEGHYIGYAGDFKWCPYCGSDNREVEE